ncbi:MAG: V-type ATP synthase subunit I [Lachnospiraceae bacterium]|nr:V-type ATP synthase subunit I [Lachnospiraceae bacterium]
MAIVSMKKIHICAMKKNRKAILEMLQTSGAVEVQTDLTETDAFKKMSTVTPRNQLDKHVQNTDTALEILNKYVPENSGIFASLEGKNEIEKAFMDEVTQKHHKFNRIVYKILDIEKDINACDSDIAKYEVSIESLKPWEMMDIPINTVSTKKTKVFIGSLPPNLTLDMIEEKIMEKAPDIFAYHIEIVSADKDQTCIFGICINSEADKFNEALRAQGYTRIASFSHRTPEDRIRKYEELIKEKEAKKEELIKSLEELADNRQTLKVLSDYYTIRSEKYKVLGGILQSESTFIITGYIPEKKAEKVKNKLEKNFDLVVEITDIPEDEEPPIELSNNEFFASGEGVLKSFGLPGKGEIDPTAPMSICYIILFGLMLSDAAYGFIVFLACLIILKKFPKMESGTHKAISLFMYCGLSTLFWGVLFGGYFGDLITVVSREFFHHEIIIKPVWFAPLDEPMRMLIVSLVIGLVHLYFGLILKGYMCIKQKDIVGLISDVCSWLMLITGLIMMLIPTDLFSSIASMEIHFSSGVKTLSYCLAIAGAVIIFLMSGRENKNPVVRLALGLYDLYNITGWLSDLLSYSRLLALGLATGVIAQVVNQMGSMGGDSVFGVIVFILVFIIGHVFNLAINLLGAYVHTCRLQYVEFFGKFYEGGGREFMPFKESTKYIKVRQKKQ